MLTSWRTEVIEAVESTTAKQPMTIVLGAGEPRARAFVARPALPRPTQPVFSQPPVRHEGLRADGDLPESPPPSGAAWTVGVQLAPHPLVTAAGVGLVDQTG